MSKKSSYFKSKKGFSLLELLCAVVIMALVVSATATGLAVSYKSIMLGSDKDQASAKAQEYCDIIMTYIEHTPSNDPTKITNWATLPASQQAKNQLFEEQKFSAGTNLFSGPIMNSLDEDIPNIQQLKTPGDVPSHTIDEDKPFFTVETNGDYEDKITKIKYVSYQVTVYVGYDNNRRTTYCTGSIIKPMYAP